MSERRVSLVGLIFVLALAQAALAAGPREARPDGIAPQAPVATEQVRQCDDSIFTTGRAAVVVFAGGNGFGIGFATRVTTLAALRLWKQFVYLVNDGVTVNLVFFGSKTQHAAKNCGHCQHHACCNQDSG